MARTIDILIDYIKNQKTEEVKQILEEKGIDINTIVDSNKKETVLHLAAPIGNKEIIKLLLAKGADPNAKNHLNQTPVHLALNNDLGSETIELLIKSFEDINSKDKWDNTLLHIAARIRNQEIIKELVVNNDDSNVTNHASQTPVHLAVANNSDKIPLYVAERLRIKKIIMLLLAKGANCNALNHGNQTPLHLAVDSNLGPEIIKLLLESFEDINKKDNSGKTPLHVAAAIGNVESIELLLANKADIKDKDDFNLTPTSRAVIDDKEEAFKVLIKHGGQWDTSVLDHAKKDIERFESLAKEALTDGADQSNTSLLGKTSLFLLDQTLAEEAKEETEGFANF